MRQYAKIADKYAHDVAAGKRVANDLVTLACRRHIDDRRKKNWRFKWDAKEAGRVCSIIELLPHVKGRWARQRQDFRLEPWQIFIVCSVFGWLDKNGSRRFRECYIQVPRKNGKSLLAAAVGLVCFACDSEEGAECLVGATTERQAWEVFGASKQMASKTPDFLDACGVEITAKSLVIQDSNSKMIPIIGKPGDGSNPSCAIIDEYHEHKTPEMYNTMLTGMGARDNPLLFIITTAGTDTAGPCYERFDYAKRVLTGNADDDRFFALVYGIDEADDWTEPAALEKANPNLGVSVNREFLLEEQRKAAQNPARANIYRIKHLNQWVHAKQTWLNLIEWNACASGMALDDVRHLPAVLSIDFAQKVDLCAATLVFFDKTGASCNYHVFPQFWLPSDAIEKDYSGRYEAWHNAGLLETTDGAELDYNAVLQWIRDKYAEFQILETVYDPWRSSFLIQQLLDDGIVAVEFRNTPKNLTEAMKETEAAIASGRLTHTGHPILNWCAGNAVQKTLPNELTTITKEKPQNKIDGMSALLMAIGRATYAQEPQKVISIYESTAL
jgi:phage terminase large subunit-like protein